MYAQFEDELHVYNEATTEWVKYEKAETVDTPDPTVEEVQRLTDRVDMLEVENMGSEKTIKALSMRLRQFEIRDEAQKKKETKVRERNDIMLWTVVASLTGFLAWSHGLIDMVMSSF